MPWRAIAEMLGIEADPTVDDGSCLTVLERQQQAQARLKLHQQQSTSAAMTTGNANTQDNIFPSLLLTAFQPSGNGQCRRRQDNYSGNLLGVELSCNNGWDDLVQYPMMGGGDVESSCNNGPTAAGIPSTFSCPRIVAIDEAKDIAHVVKKRKILSTHDPLAIHGVAAKEANGNKMIKGDPDGPTPQPKEEEEEEILQPNCTTTTNNNNKDKKNSNTTKNKEETSADSSKDTSKVSGEVQKPDYIHVRARRGQATDSHSLAERVRREKISERMKYLQDLVPGCNRITGKAGMLDEIINYVQCLQRQVEFLSMKLAAVNPTLTFNPDGLLTSEENFPACGGGIPVAISSELIDPACFSFNVMQQPAAANCGLHMSMNTQPEPALRRAVSVPSPVPDAFDDTFFDVLGASSAWDSDLQGLHNGGFHHGKASFQEILGANNLKMEMM